MGLEIYYIYIYEITYLENRIYIYIEEDIQTATVPERSKGVDLSSTA